MLAKGSRGQEGTVSKNPVSRHPGRQLFHRALAQDASAGLGQQTQPVTKLERAGRGCPLPFLGRVSLLKNSRWKGRELWEVGTAGRWGRPVWHGDGLVPGSRENQERPPGHLPAHFSLSPGLGHTRHIWTQAWEGGEAPALPAAGLTEQGVIFEESNYPTQATASTWNARGPGVSP